MLCAPTFTTTPPGPNDATNARDTSEALKPLPSVANKNSPRVSYLEAFISANTARNVPTIAKSSKFHMEDRDQRGNAWKLLCFALVLIVSHPSPALVLFTQGPGSVAEGGEPEPQGIGLTIP